MSKKAATRLVADSCVCVGVLRTATPTCTHKTSSFCECRHGVELSVCDVWPGIAFGILKVDTAGFPADRRRYVSSGSFPLV